MSDIPLLFEAGDPAAFDAVVLVDAPDDGSPGPAADRARPRRPRTPIGMLAAQAPSGPKRARSTYVIDNDGDRTALEARGTRGLAQLALARAALDLAPAPAYPPTRAPRARVFRVERP